MKKASKPKTKSSKSFKEPEELFRLAVEAAPSAMIMTGRDGRIVLANSQAERVFGWRTEDLLGRPLDVLIPPRFRRGHAGHAASFFAKPVARPMGAGRDLFGVRKDGTEIPIEIGLNPLPTSEGSFVLASITDLTERRVMEKKLAHSEAMAAVGGMAAAVAHEIRNPLASITMAAKALARGGLSREELSQVMTVLVNESQRLNRTLDDFLQFARPRMPKLQRGDINAAVREVIEAVKSDQAMVGRTVVKQFFDNNLPPLAFDADQLRQVLWNIIRNAFQALSGKGIVEIATEARPSQAVIHIKDTGPGIGKEQMENLFSPFYTTKPKGTGLGLSISRNILLAHGGDITVDSAPGAGARFSILLPISAQARPA